MKKWEAEIARLEEKIDLNSARWNKIASIIETISNDLDRRLHKLEKDALKPPATDLIQMAIQLESLTEQVDVMWEKMGMTPFGPEKGKSLEQGLKELMEEYEEHGVGYVMLDLKRLLASAKLGDKK